MTTAAVAPFAGDPQLTLQLIREHGIKDPEYQRILGILGREPTFTELGIFSALWSEHCAYKHSKLILKQFPTTGPRVLQGPGENAGVLALGEGWAVAFKIESHNHPTAVEPYQGAATGVGGILRDVFTMGARPVALLNSIRFGPLSDAHNRYLFAGAVRGIGDYGNCVGIPTVGGETVFAPCYSGNPLVNAMCVGLVREEDLMRAIASGVGNELIAVGARTGRDGIHGASFASEDLTQDSESRRPQVQVGDPFTEKLLLEASLELIRSGHIIAIQDMGAAGLTSSSAEMAARGGVGVEIDTSLVPTREPNMTPYELLLSESQERMLVVGLKGRFEEISKITGKWELEAVRIGRVTDDEMFRVTHAGRIVAEIPGRRLVEDCPVYSPVAEEDGDAPARRAMRPTGGDPAADDAILTLLQEPTIASKRWVFQQYDSTVRASTTIGPGGDAGVINVPGTRLGIALATDGNARYVKLDPFEGGKAVVAEAARNVAVTGARPIGITNCLNFGNPERPAVFFEFREACRGISAACAALGTPVTGGNVSFYNESPRGAIDPTPVIGMVGLLEDVSHVVRHHFQQEGDTILLIGSTMGHMGGSTYWRVIHDTFGGPPPPVDLPAEKTLIEVLVQGAQAALLRSAHDLSDGGLAIGLVESCIGPPYATTPFGASVNLTVGSLTQTQMLFAEDHGRAVVSVAPENLSRVEGLARSVGLQTSSIGKVGGPGESIEIQTNDGTITLDSVMVRQIYLDAIPRLMQSPVDPQTTA